jgi:hypothetical protein
MWESPLYRFKTDVKGKKKEIIIDVTGSAPNFSTPGKQLEGTFAVLLGGLEPSKTTILDFGGAKLRNTLYLLEKGYTVYSCEYKDLFKKSRQAKNYLAKAKEYDNFRQLIFPNDFIKFKKKFDIVLLINVLNIIPKPIERLCILVLCKSKMKKNGRLLWYTQHGTYSDYDAIARVADGIVTGKRQEYKMFYRDFTRKEIHEMLTSTGFSHNRNFTFPMSGSNQAYAFYPEGEILVDETLELTKLLKGKFRLDVKTIERKTRWISTEEGKPSKKITYRTKIPKRVQTAKSIQIHETYTNELKRVKPGRKEASKYHGLIFTILKYIFDGRLRKPKMEDEIPGGQRVDITFKNYREKGFFKQLDEGYKIVCPNIFIECKNYSEDLENPEFEQICRRLNRIRGQFGIIICRSIESPGKIKDKQIDIQKDGKYIILLDDADITSLVKMKMAGDEDGIDDFFEGKFRVLI